MVKTLLWGVISWFVVKPRYYAPHRLINLLTGLCLDYTLYSGSAAPDPGAQSDPQVGLWRWKFVVQLGGSFLHQFKRLG